MLIGESANSRLNSCFGKLDNYRPQRSLGKVIFSESCVKNSVNGGVHGRGVCMAGGCMWQGACMAGGVHGGGHVWQGGMCGRGACMARVCAWLRGVCMAGGACVADTTRYRQ